MDSRLVVQQLLGLWTVRSPHLRRLHELALEAASQLDLVGYRWVPREQNARADALVAAVLT
jgi:probable phosphoglycerate mutase